MKIITISREFGSGGRELGKRLSEALGIPCYDREILDMVASKKGLDKNYVEHMSEKDIRVYYPSTIGRSFYLPSVSFNHAVDIASAEHEIIKELAAKGNCIIVGRCADEILRDMKPFRIFVCSDMDARLERCKAKADENEKLSDKELRRKIKEIDRKRAAYRANYSDSKWGDPRAFDLCINTAGKDIKSLIPALTDFIKASL